MSNATANGSVVRNSWHLTQEHYIITGDDSVVIGFNYWTIVLDKNLTKSSQYDLGVDLKGTYTLKQAENTIEQKTNESMMTFGFAKGDSAIADTNSNEHIQGITLPRRLDEYSVVFTVSYNVTSSSGAKETLTGTSTATITVVVPAKKYQPPTMNNISAYRVTTQSGTGFSPNVDTNGEGVYVQCSYTPAVAQQGQTLTEKLEVIFPETSVGTSTTKTMQIDDATKDAYVYSTPWTLPVYESSGSITVRITDTISTGEVYTYDYQTFVSATTTVTGESNSLLDFCLVNEYAKVATNDKWAPLRYYVQKEDSGAISYDVLYEKPTDWDSNKTKYYKVLSSQKSVALGGVARDKDSELPLGGRGNFDIYTDVTLKADQELRNTVVSKNWSGVYDDYTTDKQLTDCSMVNVNKILSTTINNTVSNSVNGEDGEHKVGLSWNGSRPIIGVDASVFTLGLMNDMPSKSGNCLTLGSTGVKIQWGTVSVSGSANAVGHKAVTFPTAFNSTPVVIISANTTVPYTTVRGCGASGISTAGFTAYCTRTNTTTTNLSWIAIG